MRRRDGGSTLLGGSPLRLLRLAPRARELLTGERLVVRDATTASLAARLLDAGLAHPDLAPATGAADVTVVVPGQGPAGRAGPAARRPARRSGTAGVPVVVVDDGSASPVRADGAVVVRHATSRGPAAARNAGLREVRTPFVAFLDSDCVPRPGWLPVLRAHLADPRLAVVAPRIVGLPGRGWLHEQESVAGALDMGARPAPVRPLSAVSYVPSAALLCRRSALGAAGFDEALRVAEDVDLVWRLSAAGWRVRLEPAAEVAHENPTRVGEWVRRRAFYGTGAALLAERHGAPGLAAGHRPGAGGRRGAGGGRGPGRTGRGRGRGRRPGGPAVPPAGPAGGAPARWPWPPS